MGVPLSKQPASPARKRQIEWIMRPTTNKRKNKQAALCRAVLSKCSQSVKRVFKEGVDLDERNCYGGMTAVQLAVDLNLPDVLEELIFIGADVNIPARNSPCFTPLISAIKKDNVAMFRQLLFAGADPEKSDSNGKTPLHYAAMYSPNSIELLFKFAVDFNIADNKFMTPLIYAIKSDQIESVKELLNGGADPLMANHWGETALHHAAKCSERSVELLLSKGVHVDVIGQCDNFRNRQSPLMAAVQAGNLTNLLVLLNNGADVNLRSGDMRTPLHFAKSNRAVEILFEWGADINVWDMNGQTPLHWAADQNNEEVIEALLTFGPPPRDYRLKIPHWFPFRRRNISEIMIKFKHIYYGHLTFISFDPPDFDDSNFIDRCLLEFERIREVMFGRLSLCQLLNQGLTLTDCTFGANAEISKFLENERFEHDFPLYHTILRRFLTVAIRKCSLIYDAVGNLTSVLQNNFQGVRLPPEIVSEIISYLDRADLICLKRL